MACCRAFVFVTVCLAPVYCQIMHLRDGPEMSFLPENTPVSRFFKYSFARLDEGDAKSLAIVMKGAYHDLCAAVHGCDRAKAELEEMYERRFNELQISFDKMRKLGFLFRMLLSSVGVNDKKPGANVQKSS